MPLLSEIERRDNFVCSAVVRKIMGIVVLMASVDVGDQFVTPSVRICKNCQRCVDWMAAAMPQCTRSSGLRHHVRVDCGYSPTRSPASVEEISKSVQISECECRCGKSDTSFLGQRNWNDEIASKRIFLNLFKRNLADFKQFFRHFSFGITV